MPIRQLLCSYLISWAKIAFMQSRMHIFMVSFNSINEYLSFKSIIGQEMGLKYQKLTEVEKSFLIKTYAQQIYNSGEN